MFSKILGFGSSAPHEIAKDLSRLNTVKFGLGKKAIAYVMSGDGGEVLSTIANVGVADVLDLEAQYSHGDIIEARRKYLARSLTDAHVAARYGEVLAASVGQAPKNLLGSKHVPLSLRLLFGQASHGLFDRQNYQPLSYLSGEKLCLTPDFSVQLCKAAGGSAVDLFDLVFFENTGWYFGNLSHLLKVFDFSNLVEANPAALIEAAGRMGAPARAALVKQMGEWQLATTPEFIDLTFDLCADSAKSVRAAAKSVLMGAKPELIETNAKKRLNARAVGVRAAMVDLLSGLKTKEALSILTAHLKNEKTARIRSMIENLVSVETVSEGLDQDKDHLGSYRAIDGSRVEIPAVRAVKTGVPERFGTDDRKQLDELIKQKNAARKQMHQAMKGQLYRRKLNLLPTSYTRDALALFNDDKNAPELERHGGISRLLNYDFKDQWTLPALRRLPQDRALKVAVRLAGGYNDVFSGFTNMAGSVFLAEYARGENGDLRVLEQLACEAGVKAHFGYWNDQKIRVMVKGDWLRLELMRSYMHTDPMDMPHDALWPMLAENFDVFDEAFSTGISDNMALNKERAIAFLQALPSTPLRFYGTLLEVATGITKTGRVEARKMLAGAPGLQARLVTLLGDSRQAVRAGAAEWIADMQLKGPVKQIKARLKKEKSDLARAAMLTALSRLGVDLDDYIGPKALTDEAAKVLAKARLDKLDWLLSGPLPRLSFRGGRKVPPDVLKAWIYLAFKLKQPGGNALFDIYMAQLKPQDAVSLSTWIFNAWVNFDTERPSQEGANAHAKANVQTTYKMWSQWDKTMTKERAYQMVLGEYMAVYPNSGTATKGVLALARHTPPEQATAQVQQYLKNHGKRTSQANALLEMLAAKGDPTSLQVVIAAATRLKQKSVQANASKLIEQVAEARNWSLNELADRTIPVAGLNDDGILELPCGAAGKAYTGLIGDDFRLVLKNPDGKKIKTLPAGDDDNTKASKKQLGAARRELKQVIEMQGERLYEALCAERDWPVEDWQRDFRDHPVMRRLTERVVWLGLDENGVIAGSFRPTAEGDYINADDEAVDPAGFSSLRLAHGALITPELAEKWQAHLADYEVNLLFAQFGRPLFRADTDMGKLSKIEDRKGWMSDTFTFRGAAKKLGYERGAPEDGGFFFQYIKSFKDAGLHAVIEFSGNSLPEENVAAAMFHVEFQNSAGGRQAVLIKDVPPVLLSECWNDYRDMIAKGSFDADWKKKMPWM
ncbi:MAG: DUF4132 domain-containing protein [Rhodobacteraceae bacterium]|nr:DUF4132 domain-containing protein [Paracoccaceae bacterium]